jgi:cold shock CspA family protein
LARGRVDWYGANQGHGFIIPEDGGPKVFMRREGIKAGEEKALENNNEVSYEAYQSAQGPEARNVSRT